MLEPLQKVVRLSPPIAASLAVPEIFTRTVQKLGHKDAVTRLNLLRILSTICDAREEECTLIKQFGVYDTILHLSNHDPAVLVRQMAEALVRACDEVGKRSVGRASGFRRPASSAGARAGSGSSSGSTVVSGMTPPTPTSMKNKFALPPLSPIPSSSTRERERERIGRSQSTAGIWDLQAEQPPKMASLARASTSLAVVGGTSAPSSTRTPITGARPPSRDSSFARLDNSSRDAAGSGKSRLPKARTGAGRLSEVVSRRRDRESGIGATGEENQTPAAPLPRLQIARRRRETSGGELQLPRRGSRVSEDQHS